MNLRLFSATLSGVLCLSATSLAVDQTSSPEGPATPANPVTPAAPATPAVVQKENTPASMVQAFFTNLAKDQIDEAYNGLLEGSRINETPSDVLMLKKKTRDGLKLVGGIRGAELLDKKKPGTHLYALTYVSLGNDYPLQWSFFFYKRADGWRLIDIRISDRLQDFFGPEAATPAPAQPLPPNQ